MAVAAQDVSHFLGRIGFIPTDAEIALFVGREIGDIVNEVLTASADPVGQPGHIGIDDQEWLANNRTMDWWANRMRVSRWDNRTPGLPNPLVEKMTLFWHGHFATEFQKLNDAKLMWEQNNIFRNNALGDFEQLAQQVSIHGAMLIYLDNESNVAGGVQENFARELMELFTMGIGNYTEDDVVAMARAWTGHGTIGWISAEDRYDGTYEFHPDDHDYGSKTIFGMTQNWDGPGTITEICRGARQQATARFIATKLWRFFVHSAPSSAVVDQLASVFVTSGMSLRELMRALLVHSEFWAPASRNAIVKPPMQYVVDFARRTNMPFAEEGLRWQMRPMGQTLFDPPNVAGWGTNGYWLSTATMWGRAVFATHQRWPLSQAGFLAELETMDPTTGVNHLLTTFGIRGVTAPTYAALLQWFETTLPIAPWALAPVGISLVAMTPEFQVA